MRTASRCQEIYNGGMTIEHEGLDYASRHLAEIGENLSSSIQNAPANEPFTKEDYELQDLAVKCAKSA